MALKPVILKCYPKAWFKDMIWMKLGSYSAWTCCRWNFQFEGAREVEQPRFFEHIFQSWPYFNFDAISPVEKLPQFSWCYSGSSTSPFLCDGPVFYFQVKSFSWWGWVSTSTLVPLVLRPWNSWMCSNWDSVDSILKKRILFVGTIGIPRCFLSRFVESLKKHTRGTILIVRRCLSISWNSYSCKFLDS